MSKPYRKGAIAYVLNSGKELLLVQLNSYKEDEWNLPGGGRDEGEDAKQNALRELKEELGISAEDLELVGVSSSPVQYDFPQEMVDNKEPIAMKFRGQSKDQVVFNFVGDGSQFELNTEELRQYKWCKVDDLDEHLKFPGQFEQSLQTVKEFYEL